MYLHLSWRDIAWFWGNMRCWLSSERGKHQHPLLTSPPTPGSLQSFAHLPLDEGRSVNWVSCRRGAAFSQMILMCMQSLKVFFLLIFWIFSVFKLQLVQKAKYLLIQYTKFMILLFIKAKIVENSSYGMQKKPQLVLMKDFLKEILLFWTMNLSFILPQLHLLLKINLLFCNNC